MSTTGVDNFQKPQNIVGLNKNDLQKAVDKLGEKSFRTKQIWHLLYNRGIKSFDEMSLLPKDLREKLKEHFVLSRPEVVLEQTSVDNSRKWLLRFDDKTEIETVYIPEDDRGALCISTQAGCKAGCAFCNTGRQGFTRDLTAYEIVSQFMLARDIYGEWPTPTSETRYLSNVVVMGMGEPLFNYDNVATALKILMDGDGISISKRRITLSTCGVVPMMKKAASELGVKLAVSLHASTNEIRNQIMPINKKYPLEELMKACQEYQEIAGTRQRITFEYVMLKDVNDSTQDAKNLISMVKGHNIGAKFNLIPFNPWPGCKYECSSSKKIKTFTTILEDAGFACPVRVSRGQDILAACGQLSAQNKELKSQI
ncbi:MAG: 23S rRNA (adenine(2503)-C(2))-methyltransferase RlmN [Alphaproteobacteria bacterium]